MTLRANWNYPTAIRFGAGRIVELPQLCAEVGMRNPLVVTDAGLAKLPLMERIQQILSDNQLVFGRFFDVKPNPDSDDVDAGVAVYRAGQHDGIVAVGGGSALDVAKAIGVIVNQTCSLWDLEDVGDNWKNADSSKIVKVIAVPTTAGTGSEVGRSSLIIDAKAHRKVIIFHPKMLPEIVLADPELTVALPPHLTASTGIDAFVHNLEAFCSPFYHPIAHGVALQGMKLVKDWLPVAYKEGGNIEARSNMLSASIMGATAFQKGLGGVHALAHPVGAVFGTPHGLANAILLPYVLKRNQAGVSERLTEAARYLDLPNPSFESFMAWVMQLRTELAIPHSLGDIGIDEAQADFIGTSAKNDPSDGCNPVTLTAEDYKDIFIKAVRGTL